MEDNRIAEIEAILADHAQKWIEQGNRLRVGDWSQILRPADTSRSCCLIGAYLGIEIGQLSLDHSASRKAAALLRVDVNTIFQIAGGFDQPDPDLASITATSSPWHLLGIRLHRRFANHIE